MIVLAFHSYLPPGVLWLAQLFDFALMVFLLLRFVRATDDLHEIRLHLDRAVPDAVKAQKARVREKLAAAVHA